MCLSQIKDWLVSMIEPHLGPPWPPLEEPDFEDEPVEPEVDYPVTVTEPPTYGRSDYDQGP